MIDVSQVFETAFGTLRRRSILTELLWVIGIIAFSMVCVAILSPSSVVLTCFEYVLYLLIVVFLFLYLVLSFTNPEVMRSEKYILDRFMAEQRQVGDDTTGLTGFDPAQDQIEGTVIEEKNDTLNSTD